MENEQTPLTDLLNDAPPEIVEDEAPRDEQGRFAPKGVEESAPPAPDMLPQDVYEPLRAVRDENKALKDKLSQLEQRVNQQQNPPAEPTSIWEDDAKWQNEFGSQVVGQAVNQATSLARLDMSEMLVRQAKPDFEEKKAAFLQLVEQNPTLRQQALDDPHPWNKAYEIAENHEAMQQLGATNVKTLEAKIREQVMAEIQGQMPPVTRSGIPQSLSSEQNVGGRTGPAWTGPRPLSELLG